MECHVVRELLPVHAVDGLEPREARLIDVHIAVCNDCRRVFEQYGASLDVMPDALTAASRLELPTELKSKVLVSASVVLPTTGGEREAASIQPAPKSAVGGAARRWYLTPRAVATAAAVAVIVGVLAWSAHLSVALGRERNVRQELAALLGQQEIVLEVVDSNKTVKAVLKAEDPGLTSYGKLYTRPDFSQVVAMTGRLPQAAPGEGYYLWVESGGLVRLAGQLTVNEDGFGLIVFDAGRVGPSFDSAFVTRQSRPTESPSGTRVIAWQRSS